MLLLTINYPEWERSKTAEQLSQIYSLYERMLADVDTNALKLAVASLIASPRPYFPHIGDIRAAIADVVICSHPSALEAWEALVTGKESTPLAKRVFQLVGVDRGDLKRMDFTTVRMYRSDFVKEYDRMVAKSREEITMLPEVREYRALLAQAPIVPSLPTGVTKKEYVAGVSEEDLPSVFSPRDIVSTVDERLREQGEKAELEAFKKAEKSRAATRAYLARIQSGN